MENSTILMIIWRNDLSRGRDGNGIQHLSADISEQPEAAQNNKLVSEQRFLHQWLHLFLP